ncbi:hypothetical protein [Agriterribacter sp.]|uniref:hypothetical protein n=1 Tax=Agriterribacter sp. TaxID=2821509 RepID=UPI002C9F2F22|nr:hypothetical protein [Agriterribacter sp.]HRP58323.1 hypothetical protein [Agriterribacter sp.]
MKRLPYIAIMCVFLWLGFVFAISFMEAWLKFRAPGVSLSVGLGIGKLVFSALNKVEWIFAAIVLSCLFFDKTIIRTSNKIWLGFIILVLLAQTFWLLPLLAARADAIINGGSSAPSSLHWLYVTAEVIKVALLFSLGAELLGYVQAKDFKKIQ